MLGKASIAPPFVYQIVPFDLRNALTFAICYRNTVTIGNWRLCGEFENRKKLPEPNKLYPKVKVYISKPLPNTSITIWWLPYPSCIIRL
jgi:hypothetical protein